MDIINRILNTTPNCLPPVHRAKNGFHSIDVHYRCFRMKYESDSLSDVLEQYLLFVIEVNQNTPNPSG